MGLANMMTSDQYMAALTGRYPSSSSVSGYSDITNMGDQYLGTGTTSTGTTTGATTGATTAGTTTGTNTGLSAIQNDYNKWYTDTPVGTTQDFAGGKITMGSNGALWTGADGNTVLFQKDSDLNQIASENKAVADAWGSNYDYTPSGSSSTAGDLTSSLLEIFQPNLFSSSGSSSNSNSYSGMPNSYYSTLYPILQNAASDAITNYNTNVDQYAQSAADRYALQSRQAMQEQLPQVLEQMGAKNMLNSSLTSDAIAKAAKDINTEYAGKTYESDQNAALLKNQFLNYLNAMMGLGKQSTMASTGESTSSNPLEPYQLLVNYLSSMYV